jgi:CBS domain-containing protein
MQACKAITATLLLHHRATKQRNTMRLLAVLCYCLACSLHTNAFSASSNKRVFVGTPVSNYPKHLGTKRKLVSVWHYSQRVSYSILLSNIVEDRMTTNPKCLHPDTSVDEAIVTLMGWGVTGAPIVDINTSRKLLGVVSSYDFLQKEAFEGALLPMEGSEQNVQTYANAAARICGQSCRDIMTTNPRTVSPKDTMRVAAELMSRERLHHLPVVDKEGNILGILTPADVMMDLVHVVRNLPPAQEEEEENDKVEISADAMP